VYWRPRRESTDGRVSTDRDQPGERSCAGTELVGFDAQPLKQNGHRPSVYGSSPDEQYSSGRGFSPQLVGVPWFLEQSGTDHHLTLMCELRRTGRISIHGLRRVS
jgi:hypothetical protein